MKYWKMILDKLDNTQTKDRIAAILRQEILSGRIADGDELTQEQVADSLGVSRMPIREAFQTLELEGFLWRLPNRHIMVVGLNKDTLHDNFQMIAAVEIEVVTVFIQTKKQGVHLLYECDEQFHKQFSSLIDNRYLGQFHWRLLQGYPQYVWDNEMIKADTLPLHQALLTAIDVADLATVAKCIRQYYQLLAEALIHKVTRS